MSIDEQQLTLFEERAENLSPEQFEAWTAPNPHEEQIIRQLVSQGPKLLSGPRGCGKTTLLLRAARAIRRRGSALPVYVNYGRSMFMEPAFTRRADADGFFQDWLVAKVLVALSGASKEGNSISEITELAENARRFIDRAERDPNATRPEFPGPTQLAQKLEHWAAELDASRVVLLLDDAAHAFVPEQQRVFFEFLRNIRTPAVTFKAAIYPGVTEFSPNFHVGHDAKVVRAWVSVDSTDYFGFMNAIFERRIPARLRARISKGVVQLFASASFGIPRTFFSMIEEYLESKDRDSPRSARVANTVITEHADQLRALHRSLSTKLPRYRRYVEAGEMVLDRILTEIRVLNESRQERDSESQALDVAIKHPIDTRLVTILGLLEYGGLVRQTNESVSLGNTGTFSKYAIHGCLLAASSAVKFGQNPTLERRAESLVRKSRKGSYKRLGSNVLLTDSQAEKCKLVVANCHNCGAPRIVENARFCSVCGSELIDASRLDELMRATIEQLPLTATKLSALHEQGFEKIEDLIRDRGLAEISKAKRIGPVWARRIYSIAEEFVGV